MILHVRYAHISQVDAERHRPIIGFRIKTYYIRKHNIIIKLNYPIKRVIRTRRLGNKYENFVFNGWEGWREKAGKEGEMEKKKSNEERRMVDWVNSNHV